MVILSVPNKCILLVMMIMMTMMMMMMMMVVVVEVMLVVIMMHNCFADARKFWQNDKDVVCVKIAARVRKSVVHLLWRQTLNMACRHKIFFW